MSNTYWVYIIASKSNTLYVGITNDLERRVYEHKNKLIKGFTPLEKAADSCRRLGIVSDAGGLMPPASTVKRPLSLTGFTQKYNIDKLVYFQQYNSPEEAISAEKKIKGWTRKKKIDLIKSINPGFRDLSQTS